MELLEYILCRLYINGNDPIKSTYILAVLGYTKEDIDEVDEKIVQPNWPDSLEDSMTYSKNKVQEYEVGC